MLFINPTQFRAQGCPYTNTSIKLMWRLPGRPVIITSSRITVMQAVTHSSRCTGTKKNKRKAITMQTIYPNILKIQYAILGPLVMRSLAIKKELAEGASKPFKSVINANIGDAHAMEQRPITFIRQVCACVLHNELLDSDKYPADVKERARAILSGCAGQSAGSYTGPCGIELVRSHVAEYIERRDGHKPALQDVCLIAGTTGGIKHILQLFCNEVGGKNTGVLIPIPQYPLYSATLAEYGLGQVGYYLNEDNNWSLDPAELERAFQGGSKQHAVRGLVVINPGNPTGQVLTKENIEEVVKFAQRHTLFVMADEVYQDNIYAANSQFFSFKKVMTDMGPPYNQIELASFMSISKGYMCECGLRGGWMELVNLDPEVKANLYKAISVMLCPNTMGQAVVDCIARTPVSGEPSYDLWCEEKTQRLSSLNQRSKMVVETFNHMQGFKCNLVQGAMYAFPRIELPPKAIEAAKAEGKPPDAFYAFKLLEETGICIVPGSGFGQRPGTFHFRTTILPQPELLKKMLDIFKVFHEKFTKEYS